jgi:hypothetical protein
MIRNVFRAWRVAPIDNRRKIDELALGRPGPWDGVVAVPVLCRRGASAPVAKPCHRVDRLLEIGVYECLSVA